MTKKSQYDDLNRDLKNYLAPIKPLDPLPSRNYDLPVQKRAMANVDNVWEDKRGYIKPKQLNPWEEGTPQAFGGTAGAISAPDPSSLPDVPDTIQNPKNPKNPKDISRRTTAVLNRDTLFNLSDYERVMLMKERERLNNISDKANEKIGLSSKSRRFYNLSLEEVARNTVLSVIAIFVDILKFFEENRKDMSYTESLNRFFMIFLQKDRMMYFGVFLVFLSALFMVVFLSS